MPYTDLSGAHMDRKGKTHHQLVKMEHRYGVARLRHVVPL